MKHLYILLAGLALCGSALTGCSEDYLLGEEGKTVNTGTEADVPEGYVRVSFVPQEAMQTRAAVDGISNSIYRVQILLYKNDALVESKTILDGTEGTGYVWPYEGGAYRKDLERGVTYTIVYLGNIPQEKLTDTDDKTTARIAAPDNDLFRETNMYYFFSKTFTVPTEQNTTRLQIPVVLRRLASRHIIGGYGIPDGIEAEGKDYSEKYFASLLDENHPLGIGKKLFSGMRSEIGEKFKALLIRDIVFPNAYLLNPKHIKSGTALAAWLDTNKDNYWEVYENENKDWTQTFLHNWWYNEGHTSDWYGYFNSSNKPDALFTLLNAIVDEKNESILAAILDGIKEKDYQYINDNGVGSTIGSYTSTRQEIVKALQNGLQNSALGVWDRNSKINFTINKIPTSLDFSLNAVDYKEMVVTDQPINEATTSEPNFTFLLLGTKSSDYSFASSIDISGINTPETGFVGQSLTPNVSNSYRVKPTGELQWERTTDKKVAVYFSYRYVMEQLIQELNLDINLNEWIDAKGPLYFALCPLYGIYDQDTWKIHIDNGLLTTYNKGNQTCIQFPIPDFSSSNTQNAEWIVESSVSNGN
ncbi:hypothetical protein [Phocaeicola vulgatus]|uniref:hypothetical protein n=1 Tax=Phocaeicola vulgatus TaxID=821 RepID=UPI0035659580